MSEKKEQQLDSDRELIRKEMRKIVKSAEAHERDRVSAAKLLRQVNIDEADESPHDARSPFDVDPEEYWSDCKKLQNRSQPMGGTVD